MPFSFRRKPEHPWLAHLRAMYPLLGLGFLAALGVAIFLAQSPWPWPLALRHLAAFPNCAAARFLGLAPAQKGAPGYYPWHDADKDGVACEYYRAGWHVPSPLRLKTHSIHPHF